MLKKAAVKLWHRLRAWDRRTHERGRHGGIVGHAALQVAHTLIFDFLNFTSGRLDPSHAAIAAKANVCERTVRNALNRLRDLGILAWVRRCAANMRDGRFVLEQETNAYGLLPESGWLGYRPPPEAPAPALGTWGAPERMPSILDAAERTRGDIRETVRLLEQAAKGGLEMALASLGRSVATAGKVQ